MRDALRRQSEKEKKGTKVGGFVRVDLNFL